MVDVATDDEYGSHFSNRTSKTRKQCGYQRERASKSSVGTERSGPIPTLFRNSYSRPRLRFAGRVTAAMIGVTSTTCAMTTAVGV